MKNFIKTLKIIILLKLVRFFASVICFCNRVGVIPEYEFNSFKRSIKMDLNEFRSNMNKTVKDIVKKDYPEIKDDITFETVLEVCQNGGSFIDNWVVREIIRFYNLMACL